MRFLLKLLLVLIIAVVLALIARDDPGFVLLSYGDWMLETSLSLALILLAAGFFGCYLLMRFLVNTRRVPERLRQWRQRRRTAKARKTTNRGLLALTEGHWDKAERNLIRYIEYSEVPLLNYLGATRAAQKQGAEQRRDYYLAKAHQSMPEAELAIGLTQAEVQISQGQLEQALASLRHLETIAPRHVQ
ncbi:MAG: heme biosynthesis protein HemY, partial [Gammaproteobacteria bacterium]|nr:heme biosynthesis protein HemY [Gammaproteobacteria bacterium]